MVSCIHNYLFELNMATRPQVARRFEVFGTLERATNALL